MMKIRYRLTDHEEFGKWLILKAGFQDVYGVDEIQIQEVDEWDSGWYWQVTDRYGEPVSVRDRAVEFYDEDPRTGQDTYQRVTIRGDGEPI